MRMLWMGGLFVISGALASHWSGDPEHLIIWIAMGIVRNQQDIWDKVNK